MTELRKINDGNRTIAQFLGYEYIPFNNDTNITAGWWHSQTPAIVVRTKSAHKLQGNFYLGRSVKNLKFHTDWNALLGACRKFADIVVDTERERLAHNSYCVDMRYWLTRFDKEAVFETLVDGINAYNKTKTTTL